MTTRLLAGGAVLGLLAGCASLPPGAGEPKTESHALADPRDTRLGKLFSDATRQHDGHSGYRMLSAGAEGLLARVETIDAAERTLDLQYYIFRQDDTGKLVDAALLRASKRGVRIRILVDDGETLPGDEQLLGLDGQPGIEVRVFNPFVYRGHARAARAAEYLMRHPRLDYRMHNKLMIADNAVAIIGGRNIGAQYFQVDPDSQFADDDVFVAGTLVEKLSGTFDEFWNSSLSIPAAVITHRKPSAPPVASSHGTHESRVRAIGSVSATSTNFAQRLDADDPFAGMVSGALPLSWAPAQFFYDSPDKKRVRDGSAGGQLIYEPVIECVEHAASELLMVTPYLIPTPAESKLLTDLLERGVRVRILTNSMESAPEISAHSGYVRARLRLLKAGAEIHEVRSLLGSARGSGQTRAISRFGNYALHAKLYVIDRRTLITGSLNFDQRSTRLNTEDGLMIDSPVLAAQTATRFEAMTAPENAYAVTLVADASATSPRLVWKTVDQGKAVTYEKEPARSEWQRFKVGLLSLLHLDREL